MSVEGEAKSQTAFPGNHRYGSNLLALSLTDRERGNDCSDCFLLKWSLVL